ncbi:hypothetical protein DPEC_G00119740 [Dallia pectoralis]|uniref:Uncharacterized protein n=1 Tax=Dallia pectoralis TaxID=75939 RepID=A0ACC2GPM0_DALPE|nr:hypothetical protein DPEC_G00119740 [Dallia pectoralis]
MYYRAHPTCLAGDRWSHQPVTSLYPLLEEGTLEHILSCCSKALGEGRYRWRHDQVLKVITSTITYGIGHCKRLRSVKKNITFVRAGEKPLLAARATSSGLLATAQDWELEVEIPRNCCYHIAAA